MPRHHSTPADYAVKTTNGITLIDGLSQAMPHILAQPSYTPCYHFMLDVMSRTEASLLADVFYLSTLKGSVVETVKGERHILCTTEFLASSGMRWTRQEQLYNFGTLEKKGFIRRVMHGMPSRRWIVIEWKAIADAIQRAEKPDGKAYGKPDNQSSGKPDGRASSKPDGRRTVNRTLNRVTSSEESNELDVPNRPAAPASPPQPPDVGTMCDSTEPKKPRQRDSSPNRQQVAPVVDRITYTVPHQPAPTPVVNETTEVRFVGMDPDEPGYAELMASVKVPLPVSRTITADPKPGTSEIPKAAPKKSRGLLGDEADTDSQELRWAKRLYEAVKINYPTARTGRPPQWVPHFTLLLKDTTAANVERVLTWYVANMGKGEYPIQALCGKTFREKFHKLESAMKPKPLTEQQQRDLNMW